MLAIVLLTMLVMLNLVMNIGQSWHDFNALNEQTGRRLDTQASSIAQRIEDRVEVVDLTLMAVSNAVETATLSNKKLGQLASLDMETLGDVSIAVFDPAGSMRATSTSPADRHEPWFELRRNGTNIKSPTSAQPVRFDSRWSLLFVSEHRNNTGAIDAYIAMVVPLEEGFLGRLDLPLGSAILLRTHDDRVIARYPSVPAAETGSVYSVEGTKRQGPAPSTYYTRTPLDRDERLETAREIPVGPTGDTVKFEVGYSVADYRLPWQHSLYLNMAGMAIEVALLIGGMVLLRRETRLHEQVATWAGFVSTVIENIPNPIALVDRATGKIRLANETLKYKFGARAAVGGSFATLFADPAGWTRMGVQESNEPVVMRTLAGSVDMIVRCTPLRDPGSLVDDKGLVLVTLNDVSEQCDQIRQLRTEAEFDALTKLPNRRQFDRASERAVAHAQQCQSPLSVLAMDLDHFKQVNDTWGHAAGDRVLEVVAGRFTAALRDQDLPARVGGEEFAAILQGATPERALAIAKRVRLVVASMPIALDDGNVIRVTVSIGVAMYRHGESDFSVAKARADAALYRAKRSGRNRVETECEVAVPDPRCVEHGT